MVLLLRNLREGAMSLGRISIIFWIIALLLVWCGRLQHIHRLGLLWAIHWLSSIRFWIYFVRLSDSQAFSTIVRKDSQQGATKGGSTTILWPLLSLISPWGRAIKSSLFQPFVLVAVLTHSPRPPSFLSLSSSTPSSCGWTQTIMITNPTLQTIPLTLSFRSHACVLSFPP